MKKMNKPLEILGSVFFWAVVLLVNMQIIFRFVLRISVPWTEEISRMIFVYLVFIGACISVCKGESIIVDTLLNSLPSKVRGFADLLICCLNLFTVAVFDIAAVQMCIVAWPSTFSTVKWMSHSWLYVPLVFSFGVMTLHFAAKLICMVFGVCKKGAL